MMEKCQKCSGMMLVMKSKKSALPDIEKKMGLKCSRCGFYLEKQQTFSGGRYDEPSNDLPYYLRRRQSAG